MKKKLIWVTISILILLSMIIISCTQATTSPTTTSTSPQPPTSSQPTETTSQTTTPPTTTVTTSAPPTTTPTTTTANWWDKDGVPQYGGTLVYTYPFVDVITDPANDPRPSQFGAYGEFLFCDNMLTDRAEYSFQASWAPLKYLQGWIAESFEQTDPTTITVKIRQGIHWHNRAPTNGREFTADDVVFAYDRALGTGSGFDQPNPFFAPNMQSIDRVVKVDKYTVQFKLKNPSPLAIYQVTEPMLRIGFTAPEWWALSDAQKQDYHYTVGTGAWTLDDFVAGTSITCNKNPDYWGYDEKYPQNKLPYLDTWKVLAIPDVQTQIAAMRTGKADMIVDGRSHISIQQAEALNKSNPEIKVLYWTGGAGGLTFRWGAQPFTDIRVKKAMQMAIDTDMIANQYYKGMGDPTPRGIADPFLGADWSDPYSSWPQSLQDEYKYNIDEARNLMTEAGYPNGFDTEIYASTQDDIDLAQIMQSMLQHISVNATIKAEDPVTAGTITRGNKYTQTVLGAGGGLGSGPSDAITNYWSGKFERTGGVEDPVYDDYVNKFFAATTEADCQKIFKEASRYAIEQHYTLQLGTVKTPQVYQPWVKGWHGENFWSWSQWAYYQRMWIDQSLKE